MGGGGVPQSSSLDIKKANRNRACGGRAIRAKLQEEAGKEKYVYKRLYCKRWSCPDCGPLMAWQLSKDIASAATEKGLDRFLTLTLDQKTIPENSNLHRYIWNVWGKFRVYLGRKHDEAISYICVLELHKSGVPHLHALVDRFIHQKWISQAWEAVGGGPVVFIKRAGELADVGRYLAKYMTKNCSGKLTRGLRRISTSRDIKLRRFEGGGEKWEVSPIGIEMLEKIGGDGITEKLHDGNGFLKQMSAEYAIDEPKGIETVEANVLLGESLGNDNGGENGQSGIVRAGIEQRTIRERVLDTCPKEIAERLRREADAVCRKGIRGSRKR
jgi:hypothetical protein